MSDQRKISVIGLGYVGLPVAVSFAARGFDVAGFDIDRNRVKELTGGHDRTGEVGSDELAAAPVRYTADPAALKTSDFHIVTVPTPIDEANRPDLTPLITASESLGGILKRGDVVVYESTVYPGATEITCIPILEKVSGLEFGSDFTIGYSPERINPGDKEHRFESIRKVVSGSDAATLKIVSETYGAVVTAGVHEAPDIRTAEAAKIIENTQRDLNIALMNELALIFNRMGIDTQDVLAAAGTKWNFMPFVPGLVGGHCIGVDPYYLTHRAEQVGHRPDIILAGRRTNDGMGAYVARETVKRLTGGNRGDGPMTVTVLGVTFKEDVPDVRNTRVADVVAELESFDVRVQVCDPVADAAHVRQELGLTLLARADLKPADAVIVAVAHQELLDGGWDAITPLLKAGRGVVADVKAALPRDGRPGSVTLWRL